MREGFSAREVAEIVGVPESRIRYWAQVGLVGPTYRAPDGGRPSYAFSDLIAARATRELTERGVPARRVREAILALRAQLPALDRPLLHLRVLSDGERLVVAGDQPFEPLTGQRVMEFQLDELSKKVAALSAIPRLITPDLTHKEGAAAEGSGPMPSPSTALAWFERGLAHAHADERAPAIDAYRRAIALDANLGPAHANLGALLAADATTLAEAEHHLDAALACDPRCVEARANRASLHELRGEPERALALWAGLLPDAPGKLAIRAGLQRTSVLTRRRQSL